MYELAEIVSFCNICFICPVSAFHLVILIEIVDVTYLDLGVISIERMSGG